MVRVKICTNANDDITRLEIKGHANFADKGEDLVCAGVSSIAIGGLNAMDVLCADCCYLEMNDAWILMDVKHSNETVQIILKTLCIELETMEDSYGAYIEIMKEEV